MQVLFLWCLPTPNDVSSLMFSGQTTHHCELSEQHHIAKQYIIFIEL